MRASDALPAIPQEFIEIFSKFTSNQAEIINQEHNFYKEVR